MISNELLSDQGIAKKHKNRDREGGTGIRRGEPRREATAASSRVFSKRAERNPPTGERGEGRTEEEWKAPGWG